MAELVKQSGVSKATILHYVKLGLLPKPVRTNSRMAYYDPDCVKRIRRIRQLQEQRYLPLDVIKRLLDSIDIDGLRTIDRTLIEQYRQRRTFSRDELLSLHPIAPATLADLEQIGLVRPDPQGRFTNEDAVVVGCIAQMRKAGLDESLDFTPALLAPIVTVCESIIDAEFGLFNAHVFGKVPPAEAARLALSGVEQMSCLLAALHYRLVMDRLQALSPDHGKES